MQPHWLQALIDVTQDAVVSIDGEGRIVMFNPAAERMFGYSREEAQGQKVTLLMGEPYASQHDEYIRRYEATGEARAIGRIRTVTGRRKNGELFPAELSVAEVAVDDEIRYAAFLRDVSDRMRLQHQLVERERLAAIGTTAAKLAHEIGNPLNNLFLNAQLVDRAFAKAENADPKLASRLQAMIGEIRRLKKLLDDFRIASRRQRLTLEPIHPGPLIERVCDLADTDRAALGIEVHKEIAEDLPAIQGDREKLTQVLLNLCQNAVQAMPSGGTITLRARTEGEGIVLEVTDTGVGIPPDIDVFEPFTTTKADGTGLGLAIVRQIVRAHGGSVSYESAPGRGSTFRVVLLRVPPPDPPIAG